MLLSDPALLVLKLGSFSLALSHLLLEHSLDITGILVNGVKLLASLDQFPERAEFTQLITGLVHLLLSLDQTCFCLCGIGVYTF